VAKSFANSILQLVDLRELAIPEGYPKIVDTVTGEDISNLVHK
jgi:hypothetical protein